MQAWGRGSMDHPARKQEKLIHSVVDPIPPDIVAAFEADQISMNNLEMADVLLAWLALEHLLPTMNKAQAGIQCNNTAAVNWSKKFTARSKIAGHLLQALAL